MAKAEELDRSTVLMDDHTSGDRNYEEKQKIRTRGWQVVSVPDAIEMANNSYTKLTDNRYAQCVINTYQPGQRDEMHCHPGSEHIFMVAQGELHIYGVNDGEDVILKPGEFVHINQSYYYQLTNETDAVTVLFQVATKPPKPSKISRYGYRGANGVDPRTFEGDYVAE